MTRRCGRCGGPARAAGFTLIELMITVSIVAILAAIAYPAYKDSVLKGKRAQGRAALLDLMTQQERYLTQNGTYLRFTAGNASAIDNNGATVSTNPFKTYSGDNAASPAYRLGARACNSGADSTLRNCVQVFATPVNAALDPQVTELNVTSTGAKACTPSSTAQSVCWPS